MMGMLHEDDHIPSYVTLHVHVFQYGEYKAIARRVLEQRPPQLKEVKLKESNSAYVNLHGWW